MTFLFGLYLGLLILRPQEFVPMLQGVPILELILLSCLALWLVARDKHLELPPFILVALFTLFAPFTVGMSGWWGGIRPALGLLLPVAGIFLVTSMVARKLSALHACMWITLICACLLALHSAVQMRTGIGPLTGVRSYQGRPYYVGIFDDPNDLAQLFVIAIGFAVYLMAVPRSGLSKLFLLGAIGWLFYGTILTNSRGGLLGALAILGLEGWRRYGKVAVGVAAFLALPALFAATRLSQLSADEQSANDRIESWFEGLRMLQSHPLFGVGFNNFPDHNSRYLTAHNSIVLPMAELGGLGLALWLGIIWYSVRMLIWIAYGPHTRVQEKTSDSTDTAAAAEVLAGHGLFMTWVGFGITAFFLSQSYKAPLFFMCGLAVARFSAASNILPSPPSYRMVAELPRLGALTLASIVGMYVIVKFSL